MKILILSSSNPDKTAGIVAKDLLETLNTDKDITAKLLTRVWGNYINKDIIAFQTFTSYHFERIGRMARAVFRLLGIKSKSYLQIKNCDPKYYVKDYDQTKYIYSTEDILNKCGFKPDVIIVLFMSKFLTYKNLFELNKITKAPILLYMMDMAPMTGGCHYSWNCLGYLKLCGNCPALFSNNSYDQTYQNMIFNQKYIDQTNIFPIAGSEGQFLQISKSNLFNKKEKFKVLLSVNEKQYFPSDKLAARHKFQLPENSKIIFFGAGSFTEKRKGLDELLSSLKILATMIDDSQNIHLAIAGENREILERALPFPFTLLGYLDHNDLSIAYASADVFVSPSIEESGPMMINQSLMCGTPVVSFELGVALDLVITGKTGYLAKLKDCLDMARGIYNILYLNKTDYNDLSVNCREFALEKYSPLTQLRNFKEIILKCVSIN